MLRQLQQSALHAHYATELRAGLDALLRPTGRLSHCFKAVNHILATTAAMGRQPAPAEGLAVLEAQVERRCVYIYTNVYLSIHPCIHLAVLEAQVERLLECLMYMYICIHVYMKIFMCVCVCVCVCIICICIYMYIYIYIYIL